MPFGVDIAAVRAAAAGVVLKVIIETAMLTDDEKRAACRLAKEAGADFVKHPPAMAAEEQTLRMWR